MNPISALQQARDNFQKSKYNVFAQAKALAPFARQKLQGPPELPNYLPKKDPWQQKGWTKAGEGYYRKNDRGGYGFVDKGKIPASTMAKLQATPTPTPRVKSAVAAQVTQPLDTTGLTYSKFKKMAMPIFDEYEIPHAVGFGQFAGEGRLQGLGASRNNFYNIAAFDSDPNQAVGFNSPEAGIEAYAKLLSGRYKKASGELDERYLPAYALRSNPRKMLRKIQQLGYAGDPNTYSQRAANDYDSYSRFIMDTPEWREYYRP